MISKFLFMFQQYKFYLIFGQLWLRSTFLQCMFWAKTPDWPYWCKQKSIKYCNLTVHATLNKLIGSQQNILNILAFFNQTIFTQLMWTLGTNSPLKTEVFCWMDSTRPRNSSNIWTLVCSKLRFYFSSKIVHEQRLQRLLHFPCLCGKGKLWPRVCLPSDHRINRT